MDNEPIIDDCGVLDAFTSAPPMVRAFVMRLLHAPDPYLAMCDVWTALKDYADTHDRYGHGDGAKEIRDLAGEEPTEAAFFREAHAILDAAGKDAAE